MGRGWKHVGGVGGGGGLAGKGGGASGSTEAFSIPVEGSSNNQWLSLSESSGLIIMRQGFHNTVMYPPDYIPIVSISGGFFSSLFAYIGLRDKFMVLRIPGSVLINVSTRGSVPNVM